MKKIFILLVLLPVTVMLYGEIDSLQIYRNKAFLSFNRLDFYSSEHYLKKILDDPDLNISNDSLVLFYNMYTESLWQQLKTKEAAENAFITLQLCNRLFGKDDTTSINAYLQMGVVNFLSHSKPGALNYFHKARYIAEKNFKVKCRIPAEIYEWLGTVYESINDSSNALKYLRMALNIRNNCFDDWKKDFGNIYRYLGLFYKRTGNFDSSLYYLSGSKDYFDKKYGPYNFHSVKCLNNLGDLYQSWFIYDKALMHSMKAMEVCKKLPYPNVMAEVMTNLYLYELYLDLHDIEASMKYLDAALYCLGVNVEEHGSSQFDRSFDGTIKDYYLLSLLKYKTTLLSEIAEMNPGGSDSLKRKLSIVYEAIFSQMQKKEKTIYNYDDYLVQSGLYSGIYYDITVSLLEFYRSTGSLHYADQAVKYIEKSRKANKILSNDFFYHSLNCEDTATKRKLRTLDHEIFELKGRILYELHPERSINTDELILDKKIEKDLLCLQLKGEQEKEHSTEIEEESLSYISWDKIRAKLNPDEALLVYLEFYPDYYINPDKITVIYCDDDTLDFITVNDLSFVHEYLNFVSGTTDYGSAMESGAKVYNLLIRPFNVHIQDKSLVILPSRLVSQIPFESLVTGNFSGGAPEFLIKTNQTRKIFSIQDFIKGEQETPKKTFALIMAPAFDGELYEEIAELIKRNNSMHELAGALSECEQIAEILGAEPFTGKKASESIFKKYAPSSRLIHLSTHGINSYDDQMVKLAFHRDPEDKEDGYLDIYEILDLRLDCDLAVLSACQTGSGEMNELEGTLNHAWAFRQAGARSAVISLWDANDYASSQIMPAFYQYLADGYTKPMALRQAKLDFLAKADPLLKHPYYWAGFEYYGDDNEVELFRQNNIHTFLVPGVILLLLIIIFTYKNQIRKYL